MDNYIFSASRQLIFFVNINGQQRLVQFGSRNANGSSIFQTTNEKTAEAIRNHSLYRRGVVVEQVEKKPEVKKPEAPKQESHAMGVVTDKPVSQKLMLLEWWLRVRNRVRLSRLRTLHRLRACWQSVSISSTMTSRTLTS